MVKRKNMLKWPNKLLAFAGLLFLFLSCSNRPKEVLDMREMTDVLVDMHTLDGIFSSERYRTLKPEERDKYYEAVLGNHLVTREQFDSSLVWYCRDPERFEKIYVRVITRLSDEEAAVKAGKYHKLMPKVLESVNLWKDSIRFVAQHDSLSRRQLTFCIADTTLMMDDLYELHFLLQAGRGDSCAGMHAHFNLHYAGGRVDSAYVPLHADDTLRRYTLRLRARDGEKIDSLYGCFFRSDSCLEVWHTHVDSIRLLRRFDVDVQEELRLKTRRHEALRTFRYRLFPLPGETTDFVFRKNRVRMVRV